MEFLPQAEKEGSFDWIVSYENIKRFFDPALTGIPINDPALTCHILVAGCGTSTLSQSLAADFPRCEVVSVDNDEQCVNHMRLKCGSSSRLKWYQYDLIEDFGLPQDNQLDRNGWVDMVVDKGTFDAIHVEGATHNMLADIHRLLRVGGVYLLFSINSQPFLSALFGLPELDFQLTFLASGYGSCTVLLCRKRSDNPIDMDSLVLREKTVMDHYFQTENPLFTPAMEGEIREAFAVAGGDPSGGGFLPLAVVHDLLFVQRNASLGYTFDLFEADVADFDLQMAGLMCLSEAVGFLKSMQ
jgi:SAM-dependent methyltransferase